MQNIFENIPYTDGEMGKRPLVNENHLLVMQVALKPGQQVPQHNTNSNVHLLIIEGRIIVTMDGGETAANRGDFLPVASQALMSIRNDSKENASFLILKSPNPGLVKT